MIDSVKGYKHRYNTKKGSTNKFANRTSKTIHI